MPRHLLLHLCAPLLAYGGETIDAHGVGRDFPAQSMLTGLLANALGWDRSDGTRHQRLQERLRCGARLDRPGHPLTDYQTALFFRDDAGWTTRGQPEKRAGGTYEANARYGGRLTHTHIRWRDYHADAASLVALRLEPPDESPTLDELAAALQRPARPLFIGRKPCLPHVRLFAGFLDAPDLLSALTSAAPLPRATAEQARLQWPDGEGQVQHERRIDLCDERDWISGVHGGWRPVSQAAVRERQQDLTAVAPTAPAALPTPSLSDADLAPRRPAQGQLDLGDPPS